MTAKFTPRPKPEEEELRVKRQELTALENQLVERELYLVGLRAELAAFERLYLKKVGVFYSELDEIDAQIAEAHLESRRVCSEAVDAKTASPV